MSNGLSYPSLKCVLEHLEANKRIHIASRCPNLRKIERKLSLHLHYLKLEDSKVTLNRITYRLRTIFPKTDCNHEEKGVPYPIDQFGMRDSFAERVVMPGDIYTEPANDLITNEYFERFQRVDLSKNSSHLQLTHLDDEDYTKSKKILPENLKFHVAMKKLTCFLLGHRPVIKVRKLKVDIDYQKILRLPEGLKLRIQTLRTDGENVNMLSKIIDESSYPLKKFGTWIDDSPSFEHPIVQAAQILEIHSHYGYALTPWLDMLLELPNKEVKLSGTKIQMEDIISLIRNWLYVGREVGTCFTIECESRKVPIELLQAQKQFKGVFGKLKKKSQNGKYFNDHKCIAIPMSSTSELCIYRDYGYGSEVCLEVCPIDSVTPVEYDTWYSSMVATLSDSDDETDKMSLADTLLAVIFSVIVWIFIFWFIHK